MSSRAGEPLTNSGPGRAANLSIADADVGQILFEDALRLRRADLVAYAEASGDDNPIHQDEGFARSVGLPDVIAHGMLTMGLVGSCVTAACGGEGRVVEFATRFAAPVVVPEGGGVDVQVRITLVSRDDDARRVVLGAAVSVAGTKVLNRTRAVIQL